MTPLQRITERVSRHGDINDLATVRPLLILEEFFEGNEVSGSICCNCTPMPEPADVYRLLARIRSRPDVADVRVGVTMFDDPDWPFSETVWVITSAPPDQVRSWFDEYVAPDECWACWTPDVPFEPVAILPGMQPVRCWWD